MVEFVYLFRQGFFLLIDFLIEFSKFIAYFPQLTLKLLLIGLFLLKFPLNCFLLDLALSKHLLFSFPLALGLLSMGFFLCEPLLDAFGKEAKYVLKSTDLCIPRKFVLG